MSFRYESALWLLKLGTLVNLYLLLHTKASGTSSSHWWCVIVPTQILLGVSAYRCMFPVRYEHNVVLHGTVFCSIFITRVLATFSEVAYIFLFSHVLRFLNVVPSVAWINVASWLMVAQVVVSQCFVWAAILTGQFQLYFYEELGWLVIFAVDAAASVRLYFFSPTEGQGGDILLLLNIIFAAGYLPWQCIHLHFLLQNARKSTTSHKSKKSATTGPNTSKPVSLADGVWRAILVKNRRTDAESWGGSIGLTWMTAYWATLIPAWCFYIAQVLTKIEGS